MKFVLSVENVLEYLKQQQVCSSDQFLIEPVKSKEYKNVVVNREYSNVIQLTVKTSGDNTYIVKQERFIADAETYFGAKYEYLLHQLIANFSELKSIQSLIPELVDFDSENSIIAIRYLSNQLALDEFYQYNDSYPTKIAALLGNHLARFHRLTFNKPEYQEFLVKHTGNEHLGDAPYLLRSLERVGPGLFGNICSDGIEFYKLYQRFPSLHQAVVELHSSYDSSCLIHGNLRLDKYLRENKEAIATQTQVKLRDWENLNWGDPAFDLGVLISQYLKLWLDSIYVDSDTDLKLALSLATCPLEKLQPSLGELLQGYLAEFPAILDERPDFVNRVVQFTGINLIKSIQHKLEQRNLFGNGDICTLQVAKSLLCQPEQSISTVFGTTEAKAAATV
jgi:hypothetical protein